MIIDVHVHPVLFGPICTDSDRVNFRKKAFGLYKSSPVPMEQVMAIGDSGNDAEMLKLVKYAFAMGNAADSIKAIAGYATDDNNHDGALNVIQAVLDNTPPFNA